MKLMISILISICFISMGFNYVESQPEEQDFQITIQGGVTVADYKLVSFPAKPIDDQDPWTNEDILIDDLGEYNPYRWRLFRWDPSLKGGLGEYKELNQREGEITWGSDQNIDYGRGYWIISVQTKTVSVFGIADDSNKTILLERGWNQIGNPFFQNQCDLRVGPVDGPYVPLGDALNVYTDKFVWEWVEGGYQITTDPLGVGTACWIKNITESPVELQFVLCQAAPSELKSFSNDFSFLDPEQTEEPPSPPSALESSSSVSLIGSSGGGGGGCFIATAAYGDYDHPNVQLLREVRDRYLLTNSLGRMFVGMYYRYSPALARFAADREPIKVLARLTLTPVIGLSHFVSKMNAFSLLVVVAFAFLSSLFLFKRGMGGRCKPKCSRK